MSRLLSYLSLTFIGYFKSLVDIEWCLSDRIPQPVQLSQKAVRKPVLHLLCPGYSKKNKIDTTIHTINTLDSYQSEWYHKLMRGDGA